MMRNSLDWSKLLRSLSTKALWVSSRKAWRLKKILRSNHKKLWIRLNHKFYQSRKLLKLLVMHYWKTKRMVMNQVKPRMTNPINLMQVKTKMMRLQRKVLTIELRHWKKLLLRSEKTRSNRSLRWMKWWPWLRASNLKSEESYDQVLIQ